MSPDELIFDNPGPVDRADALAILDGTNDDRIASTLVALALYDPDGEWIEGVDGTPG